MKGFCPAFGGKKVKGRYSEVKGLNIRFACSKVKRFPREKVNDDFSPLCYEKFLNLVFSLKYIVLHFLTEGREVKD